MRSMGYCKMGYYIIQTAFNYVPEVLLKVLGLKKCFKLSDKEVEHIKELREIWKWTY